MTREELRRFVLLCSEPARAALWDVPRLRRYVERNGFEPFQTPSVVFVSWLPTSEGEIVGLRVMYLEGDHARAFAHLPYNLGDDQEAVLDLFGRGYDYHGSNHEDFCEYVVYRDSNGRLLLTYEYLPDGLSEDCPERLVAALAGDGRELGDD